MTKQDILEKYEDRLTGYQKNFFNKQILKNNLIKDFSLNNNQISFENESVLIKIDNQIIRLNLLIDHGEIRFRKNQ